MAVFNFLYDWYQWIVGIPLVAAVATFAWKNRSPIKENAMFFWNFKKRFEKLEEKVSGKPLSKNARFCPNCDARMKLGQVYGDGNWYKCTTCNIAQLYKTIHS